MSEDNDTPMNTAQSTFITPPKLRKNKRLEKRWGQKYYASVKEAVFIQRATPYVLVEPPPLLRNEVDCQPLYVCKQCRDCFHFQSSFEAHNSRRSWILGYWCQNCFLTECSHMQSGQPPCFDCQTINRQRKTYLRSKGLTKGRKMGCIKIFYNQCQFFEHLEKHQSSIVDMADIMLMPIPIDVEKERFSEFERLCEIIMEHMFLTRTHIMDWLKSQQFGDKWWSFLLSSSKNNENLLTEILKIPKTIHDTKKIERPPVKPPKITSASSTAPSTTSPGSSSEMRFSNSDTRSSISETIESVIAQSTCSEIEPQAESENMKIPPPLSLANTNNPSKSTESERNPSTTADIAFVDCGQATNASTPDVAILLPPKSKLKIIQNGSTHGGRMADSTAAKINSHFSSKESEILFKVKQTNKIASESLGDTPVANQGSFEPKISVKKFAYEGLKDLPVISNQKNFIKLNNKKVQGIKKLDTSSNVRSSSIKTLTSSDVEITKVLEMSKKAVAQSSLSSGPRILTVHSPKNADLSKIIQQLPPEVINGKKIVFIGQDADRFSILPRNDINTNLGFVEISTEAEKSKLMQTLPMQIAPMLASNIPNKKKAETNVQSAKETLLSVGKQPKIQQLYIDGKIICRNGKKFVIRQTRKSTSKSNSNQLNLQTVPKRISLSSLLSKSRHSITSYVPITAKCSETDTNKISPSSISSSTSVSSPSSASESPKDSRSEVQISPSGNSSIYIKSASCLNSNKPEQSDSTTVCVPPLVKAHDSDIVEYFSFEMDATGKMYVDFSKRRAKPVKINKVSGRANAALKCKEQMLGNIIHFGEARIKLLIEHLLEVNSEYSRIIGIADDERVLNNVKAIEAFKKALKKQSPLSEQNQELSEVDDNINEILQTFEKMGESSSCLVCNKTPETKASVEKPDFCSCDNYKCHICDAFQGNMSRFTAHLNFHTRRKPFNCPECFRKYLSFSKLETHVWTSCFHPLVRRWFKCNVCQIEGFPNLKSLTKHFIIAHSKLKIVCPECGILLKSRTSFDEHRETDHPKAPNLLRPVNLMECEVDNCVVRLEHFRSHMDDHVGASKMLYYKCSLCSFLVNEMEQGRDQIKAHLHHSHSEELFKFMSSESLPNVLRLKNSEESKNRLESKHADSSEVLNNSQNNDNLEMCDISMSDSNLDKKDEDKCNKNKLEQGPKISESVQKNTDLNAQETIGNHSQINDTSSDDSFDEKPTKLTLKDEVECSIGSINPANSELFQSLGAKPVISEIVTTVQEIANHNNAVTTYSSSPKIIDVRSVTPNAYEDLGSVTKKQNVKKAEGKTPILRSVLDTSNEQLSEASVAIKMLERWNQTTTLQDESEDSFFDDLEGKLMPMKLPQVIVINQAEANKNFTEILQSTMSGSNSIIISKNKLGDTNFEMKTITGNSTARLVELEPELTDKKIDTPRMKESSLPVIKTVYTLARRSGQEQCRKIRDDSMASTKPLDSIGKQLKQSVNNEKRMLPISVIKLKNNRSQKTTDDISELKDQVSDSGTQVMLTPQIATDILDGNKEEMNNPLPRIVPKPLPLARIPCMLEESQIKVEVKEEAQVSALRSPNKMRRKRKLPWRIALNGPVCSSEIIEYRCHLCKELINTSWPVIQNHFESKHFEDYELSIVTPRLLHMSSDFVTEGYKEVLGLKKRKSDGTVPSSKRRRRWNPKKRVEKHPLDLGLCVKQESMQDGEGNFICKKCDQRCNDILSLRTHIGMNHRIKDHYLVCLECGENFVVEPSLQMHLKAFHSIEDPSSYMAQNTAYAMVGTETGDTEPKTEIANQCHVCMAVFEDKPAVDKHLRVHGMAFLNRKRIEARNAARNSEKKIKIQNSDDSLTVDEKSKDQQKDNKTKAFDRVDSQLQKAFIEKESNNKTVE